jgi:hypothetical protein
MIPSSQTATSRDPKRGRTATAIPATISTTPTTYINVCAGTGTTDVATGARYIVQSARKLVNLSSPKMMGAAVNTERSRRNACRSGLMAHSRLRDVDNPVVSMVDSF